MSGWLALDADGRPVLDHYDAAIVWPTADEAARNGTPLAITPAAHPTTAYRRGLPR